MSIRKARPDEAVALHHLVLDAYGHYVARIGKTPRPMREDYAARIAKDEVWVLEEAGAVVGLLVLEDDAEGFLLDNVAVAPAKQHKGYGRALIAFAEEEGRARGHSKIRLFTHYSMVENLSLYARLGYVETGRDPEGAFGRVFMERMLSR
jgi:GNAT superfamily N-acetyltransferase